MAAGSLFLALIAIGFLVLLAKAFRQNRMLWLEVQGIRRTVPRLLWDAFLLWSPLALVIVVLAFAANRMSAATVALTYHLTTLDEFCEVRDVAGHVVIPCTGMDGVLARDAIKRAGAAADIDQFVADRFRATRRRLLGLSAEELRQAASNRPEFYRSLTAQAVLGLESAPEDDAELLRLKQELLTLLHTPTAPARNVLDMVRFITDRDARLQRMRVLTAQVNARREKVNEDAYASLALDEQGRLWLRHRISHLLAQRTVRMDATTEAALAQLQVNPGSEQDALPVVRRGIASALARNEAIAADVLLRDTRTSKESAGLYIALPLTRRCTVASPEKYLRLRTSDF